MQILLNEADGDGSDVDSNNITDLLNEPDSELSSLSHLATSQISLLATTEIKSVTMSLEVG
ncbi:CLUMA_CG002269, isoform A [Clunio marinus]|uniref:CLUMA_CG002269, isoform A n=1 Tax=Clunio marinus TaxID=568069 RepID=A0A1J1HM69_9DIPT|nr:CLUMA_CG002269, isoform A [Clunio marinus]